MGQRTVENQIKGNAAPGQFEQTTDRINSGIDTGTKIANLAGTVWNGINQYRNPQQTTPQQPIVGTNPGFGNIPPAPKKKK
jgi:hypothetical protein